MMKKIMLFTTLITIIVSCKKVDFDKKGKETFNDLKILSGLSLKLNSITGQVWNKAIYKNEYALCKSSKLEDCYISDFNHAFEKYNKEQSILNLRKTISEMEIQIALNIDSISNPSNKNKIVYEDLVALYNNSKKIASETEKTNENISSFMNKSYKIGNEINMLTKEIENQKPNWKN